MTDPVEADGDLGAYLQTLIKQIATAPELVKRFAVDQEEAVAAFRLSADRTELLAKLGMPSREQNGRLLFDEADLASVSYGWGTNTPFGSWLVLYARQLSSAGDSTHPTELRGTVACPEPGHPGPCNWGGLLAMDATVEDGKLSWSKRLPVGGEFPDAPGDIAALFDRYADVSFYLLPESLRTTTAFVRRRRLSDCVAMAQTLVEDASEAGIEARTAYGLVVTPPFSSTHSWPEFKVNERWVGYDPLLIRVLRATGVRGADPLRVTQGCSGLFHRLAETPEPLVRHAGRPCKVVVATRRQSAW